MALHEAEVETEAAARLRWWERIRHSDPAATVGLSGHRAHEAGDSSYIIQTARKPNRFVCQCVGRDAPERALQSGVSGCGIYRIEQLLTHCAQAGETKARVSGADGSGDRR